MDVFYPAVVTKEDGTYYGCIVDFDKFEDGEINYYATFGNSMVDILAQEKNLNFSQILQKALKKELGIE